MDSSHAPFLAAILADIDSDSPRLKYADFLDETGEAVHEARAEFIRLQCALEGIRLIDPRYDELAHREFQLLEAHWEDWFGPLAAALGKPIRQRKLVSLWRTTANFELGFFPGGHVIYSTGAYRRPFYCAARFRRGLVGDFEFSLNGPESVRGLCRMLALTPLNSLSPRGSVEGIHALLADNGFERIRKLILCPIPESVLRELATSERSDSLRHLKLTSGSPPDQSAADPVPILAAATHLRGLRGLELEAGDCRGTELTPLLGSPLLGRCEELTCHYFAAPDDFLFGLADERLTPNLRAVLLTLLPRPGERAASRLRERFGDRCRIISVPT